MSVLIKGMKMPKGCCECDLCDIGWGDECEPYCVITNSPLGGISNEREEWCPLVELPTPHGKLIDIDRAFDYVKAVHTLRHSINESALEIIFNSPTVIEAEE